MGKHPKGALSLGVAIIARNAEKTLGACLTSIRPYARQIVVCIDELTTDDTERVARRYGAEVHRIAVSHEHECQDHGKVMAQHFADARNESFGYLRPNLDWYMWLDSDDVFVGGEKLAAVLEGAPPEAVGFWMPYRYATLEKDGRKATNTIFHRERILRASVGWKWQYRVHEVVVPQDVEHPQWIKTEDVEVAHQAHAHEGSSSAERNLLLLEIDLEENPQDERAIWYMGNQYFAMGRWDAAADWFERHTQMGSNPYQLWQSYTLQSICLQKLGALDDARLAANEAINLFPEHGEPYIQLAATYLSAGEFDKAVYWGREARREKKPVPFFVFQNPMDSSYNLRMVLADALAQLGNIDGALGELEAAHRIFPDDRVGAAIQRYQDLQGAQAQAEGFRVLARDLDSESVVELYKRMPDSVRQFGRVRDIVAPILMKSRPSTQPRIVFWCGRSVEEWAPPSLNAGGIGGSETAVIEIAKRFAADGWRVDVFNECGRFEGIYDGVGYWDLSRVDLCAVVDLLVSWRNPAVGSVPVARTRSILWCHDLNYGPQAAKDFNVWAGFKDQGMVLGVSAWHADMLRRYYDLPKDRVSYVPNGIDPSRFDPTIKKVPWRCVYASSPDRGLMRLLQLWPGIIENEPGAELHVAYGWQTFDRMSVGRPDMQRFKAAVMERLEHTPQVVYRDRLGQDELARLYSESYAWLYPSDFLEVSCISAIEAMAGGAVPIVTRCGALPETIGDAGILVDLPGSHGPVLPHSAPWQEFYRIVARGTLADTAGRMELSKRGRERAAQLTWDAAYREHWVPLVTGLLEKREVETVSA